MMNHSIFINSIFYLKPKGEHCISANGLESKPNECIREDFSQFPQQGKQISLMFDRKENVFNKWRCLYGCRST